LAGPVVAGLVASGCSQAITTMLPDPEQGNRHVLSSAEQERAIKEMLEKKSTHQSEAIEQIVKAKAP
jgi:hypothetical protein